MWVWWGHAALANICTWTFYFHLLCLIPALLCLLYCCCTWRVLSGIVIALLGKRELYALLFVGLQHVCCCRSLFILLLDIIGINARLCSVIVAFPGHLHLRNHAYSNMLKNLPPKNENFQIKKFWYFNISAQNIDCGYSWEPPRRGGSHEYPQSMFLSRNKKTNVYCCKPHFYYIKMGFKGVKIIYAWFRVFYYY